MSACCAVWACAADTTYNRANVCQHKLSSRLACTHQQRPRSLDTFKRSHCLIHSLQRNALVLDGLIISPERLLHSFIILPSAPQCALSLRAVRSTFGHVRALLYVCTTGAHSNGLRNDPAAQVSSRQQWTTARTQQSTIILQHRSEFGNSTPEAHAQAAWRQVRT